MSWNLNVGRHRVDLAAPVLGLLTLSIVLSHATTQAARAPVSTPAPDQRGHLVGIVEDLHGDPVPGARIVLSGPAGQTLVRAADAPGALGLGEFDVEIAAGTWLIVASIDGRTSPSIRVPVSRGGETRVRLHVNDGY